MSDRSPKPVHSTKRTQARKNKPKRVALLALLWSAVLAGATLLVLVPRPVANLSQPPDANGPFSSSITVTNSGYVPLDDVTANVSWGAIKFQGPHGPITLLGDEARQAFSFKGWTAHDLDMDKSFTVSLNDIFRGDRATLLSAQIAVVIKYKLPLLPVRLEDRFPYIAHRASNGDFYWYADTLSKNSN